MDLPSSCTGDVVFSIICIVKIVVSGDSRGGIRVTVRGGIECMQGSDWLRRLSEVAKRANVIFVNSLL